jgi:LysM repeat protein/Tfp pilus assembly protein PilF
MTKCAPVWRLLVSMFLAISLVGCSQFKRSNVADEKDPYYLEGERRQSGLDWEGAIQSFERALQSNPNNAAAHLQLGVIYAERKNDFATAVYHYQKHLTLFTNSPRADTIKQQINYCKRELAKTHSYALVSRDVQRELERLTMTNQIYAKRIEQLEAELARGPRYITNFVTRYVAMPDVEQKGRGLTRPTTLVDTPPDVEQQPVESPPPAIEESRSKPQEERVAAASRPQTRTEPSNRESSTRQTPRNGAGRNSSAENTAPPTTRSTPTPSASRFRTVHTVRPGDTLDAVARRYGVSKAAIRAANPGLGGGTRAGQKINIPNK